MGAGPSGLVTAIGLRAAGVDVRVLDRASGPATTSRALGLQPRGVEVLERLGALGDLPDRALPIREVIISVDGREITRLDVGRPTPLVTRPGLMMSQAAIEAALRERLHALGGRVEWGRRITAGVEGTDGVTLTCSDGERLTADWVVGCDGAHSIVRSLAGIDFPGVPLGEQFMLADVHADLPLPRTAVTTCLRGDQIFAVFPLPGASLWRLLASWPADDQVTIGQSARLDPEVVVSRLTTLLPQHTGFPASVIRDVVWASSFHIHRRLAAAYRRGRFLLVGDAAHVHSPFGGQGMNTGIGDAENLAWKLALVVRGDAGTRLLDTYEAERRPIAAEVLSSTTSMTRLMLGATPLARVVRDRVVVPLMNRPSVQRRIREDASQLKVSYRSGPLGSTRRLAPRPDQRPGDRVPDLPCTRDDGSRTRLHSELGGRWALLGSDDATLSAVRSRLGSDAVVALQPTGHTAGSWPSRAALVRPDGHLACWATEAADWLDTVTGARGDTRVGVGAPAA